MIKVGGKNFPPEEQDEFALACRQYKLDSESFLFGAEAENPALGAGLIRRRVTVARNGRVVVYDGRTWLEDFRQELLEGKW